MGDPRDQRGRLVGWQGQGTQVVEDHTEACNVGVALQEQLARLALNVGNISGFITELEDDERPRPSLGALPRRKG
jgi:hypothetical protein